MALIAVSGSRKWQHRPTIKDFVESLDESTIICHSNAPGAAKLLGKEIRERGLAEVIVKPNVEVYEQQAMKRANDTIISLKPVKVIIFKMEGTKDKDSEDLAFKAIQNRIKVITITNEKEQDSNE